MSVRLWQLAVIGVGFATLAAGSCAKFLQYGPYPKGEPFANAFLVSAVLAGGPLLLLAYRLPRARRDGWPGIALLAKIMLAGTVAAAGGVAGAMAMATIVPIRWRIVPLAHALIVVAAAGLFAVLGAVELLALGSWRRTTERAR
jgi:hypothetical protein